jgi:hypothetical protein
MTCKAEIIVETYDDAVYVPVQAVTRVAGDAMVYILDGKSVVPRKVEIGLDNNRMIRIVTGLEEGEVVLLEPPLKSSSVDAAPAGGAEPNAGGEKPDGIDQQVRTRLDASRQTAPGPVPAAAGPKGMPQMPSQAGQTPGTPNQMPQGVSAPSPGQMPQGFPGMSPGQMPPGMPKLTPEQQKKMQEGMQKAMELIKNMSEEDKEKLKNMSREEQIKFFQEKMGGDQPK